MIGYLRSYLSTCLEVGGEDLNELLGPLLPSQLVSRILEKRPLLKDQELPPGAPFETLKETLKEDAIYFLKGL